MTRPRTIFFNARKIQSISQVCYNYAAILLVNGDTHPIRYFIAEGIEHWTKSSQRFSPVLNQYSAHLREKIEEALESQQRIGWKEATTGLLSKHWSSLSCCDMHKPGQYDLTTGARRMRTCISSLNDDHVTRLWLARNEVSMTDKSRYGQRKLQKSKYCMGNLIYCNYATAIPVNGCWTVTSTDLHPIVDDGYAELGIDRG